MKKFGLFLVLIILFMCFGCEKEPNNNENGNEDKDVFKEITDTYEIRVGDTLDFNNLFSGKLDNFTLSTSSTTIKIENNVLTALEKGEANVVVSVGDKNKTLNITIKDKIEILCDDELEMYVSETVDFKCFLKGCTIDDLEIRTPNDSVTVINKDGNLRITGNIVGETKIILAALGYEKEVYVTVKDVKIEILNDSFTVDVLETLKLNIEYPKELFDEEMTVTIAKPGIFTIENDTIYPISEGKSRVKFEIGDLKKTIEVTVTVDPVKIITLLHQDTALMKKSIKLYGGTIEEQPLMGSVSRYMFDDLNLVEDIIQIYDNPYVGQVATREIVDYLDKKKNTEVAGAPRSGVKMTGILYITYHDTANVNAGADARANANWMVNQYSVTTTARSWHYTVDTNQVIHSVPDDEVTFQGDTYEAYTTSIGIETCVNKGANLDKVWHRMGKLCALLMTKYNIDINHIKQHYDWMGKECPHTLRANGLYPYAISLVEAELIVRKYLKNYNLEFESLSPEYLDNHGQIIKAPDSEITVSYKVHITNSSGYDEEVTLSTIVTPLK